MWKEQHVWDGTKNDTFFMFVFRMQFYFWELIIRFSIPREYSFFGAPKVCVCTMLHTMFSCKHGRIYVSFSSYSFYLFMFCNLKNVWWRLKSYKIMKKKKVCHYFECVRFYCKEEFRGFRCREDVWCEEVMCLCVANGKNLAILLRTFMRSNNIMIYESEFPTLELMPQPYFREANFTWFHSK